MVESLRGASCRTEWQDRSPREAFGAQQVWPGEEKEKEIPIARGFHDLTLFSAHLWEAAVTRTTLRTRKQRLGRYKDVAC